MGGAAVGGAQGDSRRGGKWHSPRPRPLSGQGWLLAGQPCMEAVPSCGTAVRAAACLTVVLKNLAMPLSSREAKGAVYWRGEQEESGIKRQG